jgi:hypothetical protein
VTRASAFAVFAVFAAFAALACAMAPAQAQAPAPCATCGGKGLVPCRACAAVEADCVVCTVAAACPRCQGALATACPGCADRAAQDGLQRRRAEAQQFVAAGRELLAQCRVDAGTAMQCRTPHFDLLFAVGRIDGAPSADPHAQMHLFAQRLERLHARCVALFGAGPGGERVRLAVVKDGKEAQAACLLFTGVEMQGAGGASRGSKPSGVLLWGAASGKDPALHRALVHLTAHLLLAQALPDVEPDAPGFGWLDEGLAHWLEADLVDGRCENCCILGRPQPPRQFWNGDWRTGARELLEAGQLPSVAALLATDASDLDLAQHAAAFALVDFLLCKRAAAVTPAAEKPPPAPLQRLLAAARAGTRADAALAAALDRPVLDGKGAGVDGEFRDFVRRYPRQ